MRAPFPSFRLFLLEHFLGACGPEGAGGGRLASMTSIIAAILSAGSRWRSRARTGQRATTRSPWLHHWSMLSMPASLKPVR